MEDSANNSNCPQVLRCAHHDCTVYSALHVNQLTKLEMLQRYKKEPPAAHLELLAVLKKAPDLGGWGQRQIKCRLGVRACLPQRSHAGQYPSERSSSGHGQHR